MLAVDLLCHSNVRRAFARVERVAHFGFKVVVLFLFPRFSALTAPVLRHGGEFLGHDRTAAEGAVAGTPTVRARALVLGGRSFAAGPVLQILAAVLCILIAAGWQHVGRPNLDDGCLGVVVVWVLGPFGARGGGIATFDRSPRFDSRVDPVDELVSVFATIVFVEEFCRSYDVGGDGCNDDDRDNMFITEGLAGSLRRAQVEEQAAPVDQPDDGQRHELKHVQVPRFARVGAKRPAEEVAEWGGVGAHGGGRRSTKISSK